MTLFMATEFALMAFEAGKGSGNEITRKHELTRGHQFFLKSSSRHEVITDWFRRIYARIHLIPLFLRSGVFKTCELFLSSP